MTQSKTEQKNNMEYLTNAKVNKNGTVKIDGKRYFVSHTMAGQKLQIFADGQGLAAGHTGASPSFRLREV